MRALTLILLAILAVLAIGGAALWRRIDVDIPVIGLVAIGVGALITLALGAGLMALSFFSSRRGYDDRLRPDDPG